MDGPWQIPGLSYSFAEASPASEALKECLDALDSGDVDVSVASECLPWLHAHVMVSIARRQPPASLLRRFLQALAKHSLPFHGSVAEASELQIIGLAYGIEALRPRAEEAARLMHDPQTAAEVFWTFLTAKAPKEILKILLKALERTELHTPTALAVILCGLPYAPESAVAERFADALQMSSLPLPIMKLDPLNCTCSKDRSDLKWC